MKRLSYLVILGLSVTLPLAFSQAPPQRPKYTVRDPAREARLHLPVPANPSLRTLFLVGDSTVRNGHGDGSNGQWGWGEPLVSFFDTSKINVVNRAIGGLSSRTFLTGGYWDQVLPLIRKGDIVIFQFGHNDTGPVDGPHGRASIQGIGAETKVIDNPVLKQQETVHTYGWYMNQYVRETLAKGAIPILCSPIPRKIWKDGKVVRNDDNYGGWAREIAKQDHVRFIELNHIIADRYDALGAAKVEPLFADPHTHTSWAGAELNAASVVAGLKGLRHDPVAKDLSVKGKAVSAYHGG